jgi:hypothetical protein
MIRPILFAILASSASGCAMFTKHITVTVDGYAAPSAPAPGKYFLASGSTRVPESDLQFQSYSASLERALGTHGWSRVATQKDAATLIRFRYGVSDPVSSVREYDSPEFGNTGYQLNRVQTVETVNGKQVATERTLMTPTYGQTGVSRRTDVRIIYGMNAIVEAYDLAHPNTDGTPPQVWKIIVGTSDDKGDLRAALPRLLSVAAPHFGKDTHGVLESEIPAEEPGK